MAVASLAIILLLWGMFLLQYEAFLLLALTMAGVTTLYLAFRRRTSDTVAILVAVNFVYWLASGFLVGAIGPLDLVSLNFVDGDGRIFVAYLPLILFCLLDADWRSLRTLQLHGLAIAAATLALYAVWLAARPALLSEGSAGNFAAFLTSHTGAGTFFGMLSVFLILYGRESRRRSVAVAGWLMVLPLLGSGSREAILAWLVTAGWYVALTRRLRLVFAALLLVAVYVVSVPVVAPHLWARTGGVVSDMQFGGLWTAIAESQWAPGEGETDIEGKEQNILARLAFWKYGLGRFAESPLVGIGFGRCNDYDLRLTGLNGFVSLAFDGTKVLAPSSLHNSYIHGLCESGLAGVGLLMAIWAALYMRLTGARRHFGGLKDPRSFFVAAQGLIPFSMAAALTGHALAAPSLMIPVTTIIGMAVAYDRWLRSQVVTGPDAPEAGTTAVRVAPAGDPIR